MPDAERPGSDEMLREIQEWLEDKAVEEPAIDRGDDETLGPVAPEAEPEPEAVAGPRARPDPEPEPADYDRARFTPCSGCGRVIARDLARCPHCGTGAGLPAADPDRGSHWGDDDQTAGPWYLVDDESPAGRYRHTAGRPSSSYPGAMFDRGPWDQGTVWVGDRDLEADGLDRFFRRNRATLALLLRDGHRLRYQVGWSEAKFNPRSPWSWLALPGLLARDQYRRSLAWQRACHPSLTVWVICTACRRPYGTRRPPDEIEGVSVVPSALQPGTPCPGEAG